MARIMTPMDFWQRAFQTGMIMAEAQAVIAMRLWGMGGFWSIPPSENIRMMTEKIEAKTKSVLRANEALMTGKSSAQATSAALKPIRSKTRANAKRLAKRGPRLVR